MYNLSVYLIHSQIVIKNILIFSIDRNYYMNRRCIITSSLSTNIGQQE